MVDKNRKYGMSTIGVHLGAHDSMDAQFHPVNIPIYASSTFAFPTTDDGAKIFAGESDAYTYGRLSNPTINDTEVRLAALEGGEKAILFGSGMAAISTFLLATLKAGDHVIADKTLYGGAHSVFLHVLPNFGIEVTRLDTSDIESVKAALKPNTKLLYFETPTNPTLRVVPIKPIVELARANEIITAIDSTFLSPILQRPIEMGVDVVIHSATKYLNGHSDLIAGVVIGNEELLAPVFMGRVHFGGMISPFDAYLLGRGLKTLKVRMDAHEVGGRIVADYLKKQPMVKELLYLGHDSHPGHEVAKTQQSGFGSMMTIILHGDLETAKLFVDSLQLITRAVSLGGVETLISHPASTTHSDLVVPPEDKITAGIIDTLMRLSVGIEDPEDIIFDLDQAFEKIKSKVKIVAD